MLSCPLVGVLFITLARMYERRIFIPASDARCLEEHEQFNRKNRCLAGGDLYSAQSLMVSIF